MIRKDEYFGHKGWLVYESSKSTKRYFIFSDTIGFATGVKRDVIVIQVLGPLTKQIEGEDGKKQKVKDMDKWHFAKIYKSNKYTLQRVIWPPQLNKEIIQALVNCGGDEKSIIVDTDTDFDEVGG